MIRFIKELLGAPKQRCPQCHCLEQRLTTLERSVRAQGEAMPHLEVAEILKGMAALEGENARLVMQVAEKDASLRKLEAEVAHILMHVAKEEN